MYVNVGGRADLLFTGILGAEVREDAFTPENLLWVMKQEYRLLIITHPKNLESAKDLAKRHNQIYDSSLARAFRETE